MTFTDFTKLLAGVMMIILLTIAAGCRSSYYQVWESLGKEKRHLLRDQIEAVRDDQQRASEEFKDALTQLKEMYGFEGGDLETMYDRLSADYRDCEQRADIVAERIENVQRIANDLFDEWNREIDDIHNPEFKVGSRQKLKTTRARYDRLETAMLSARARMTPILIDLRDYVLYLKHNLNAQAIGSLKSEVGDIEAEVDRLIEDIERSVREADDFLAELEAGA